MKFLRAFLLVVLLAVTQTTTTLARPASKAAVRPTTKKVAPKPSVAIVKTKETAAAAMPAWKADLLHRAKVGFYFGLWYALNIVYNSKWLEVL